MWPELEYLRDNWETLTSKERVRFMKLRLQYFKENPIKVVSRPTTTRDQAFDWRTSRL